MNLYFFGFMIFGLSEYGTIEICLIRLKLTSYYYNNLEELVQRHITPAPSLMQLVHWPSVISSTFDDPKLNEKHRKKMTIQTPDFLQVLPVALEVKE